MKLKNIKDKQKVLKTTIGKRPNHQKKGVGVNEEERSAEFSSATINSKDQGEQLPRAEGTVTVTLAPNERSSVCQHPTSRCVPRPSTVLDALSSVGTTGKPKSLSVHPHDSGHVTVGHA